MSLIYPDTPHPLILHVLGTMVFHTSPMARVYRAAGHDIPTKVEDEQAFILDRMIRMVLEHGENWVEILDADYKAALARAKHLEELATAKKVADRLDQ